MNTMELKEFVSKTLIQIIEGVADAQEQTRATHGYADQRDRVHPRLNENADSSPEGKYFTTQMGELIQMVAFDVAVTTEHSSDTKAGGGIRVAGVGFGGDIAAADKDTSVSRVSFEVPVTFPREDWRNGRSENDT